ncbi:Ger(x)C family spore germination protein [Thalassobacillus pellis]|uniref:Ger(x)C family spore germination protein n=1 Tax=Thalassobacillus pellis TaxID=748008 RepID=UPI0019621641|nr:Ger(x)C family spore germination protein [Thalassobacillus pellis]MBM7553612.1 spore germination protein [Thalassobacillus pellis]
MNRLYLLFIVSFMLILSGCAYSYSVEDRNIIQIAGYDYVDEDRIKATVSIPQFGRGEKKGTSTELTKSAVGKSVKEVHEGIQRKLSKPISIGKLELSIYGEELARNGLEEIIDVLSREPEIGRNILLAIADGKASDIIETQYSKREDTAKFVTGMIKQNTMHSNFPDTNLHKFLFAFYAQGMDAYLPLVKSEGDDVKLEGIAFFKAGKFVHTVPFDKSFIFKSLVQNFKKGTKGIDFKGEHVVLENIGSQVTYRVEGTRTNPVFKINIKMNGFVNEVENIHLKLKGKVVQDIEKEFEKHLKRESEAMISKFQEIGIDPLGLGNELKNRRGKFSKREWKEMYPRIPIKIKVDAEIIESGISA